MISFKLSLYIPIGKRKDPIRFMGRSLITLVCTKRGERDRYLPRNGPLPSPCKRSLETWTTLKSVKKLLCPPPPLSLVFGMLKTPPYSFHQLKNKRIEISYFIYLCIFFNNSDSWSMNESDQGFSSDPLSLVGSSLYGYHKNINTK